MVGFNSQLARASTSMSERKAVSGLWLIAIGANSIDNGSGDSVLKFAESDARHVFAALSGQGEHTLLGHALLEDNVFAKDVSRTVTELLGRVGREDDLILYFAGHGITEQTDQGVRLFLGVHGTRSNEVEHSAIQVDSLVLQLQGCKARCVTVLLDCCFSGNATGRSLLGPRYLTELAKGRRLSRNAPTINGEGRILYGAAGKDRTAGESTLLKSGIFTYALLHVLYEHRKASTISFSKLHSEVQDWMNRRTQGRQIPYFSGDDNGAAFPTTNWQYGISR